MISKHHRYWRNTSAAGRFVAIIFVTEVIDKDKDMSRD